MTLPWAVAGRGCAHQLQDHRSACTSLHCKHKNLCAHSLLAVNGRHNSNIVYLQAAPQSTHFAAFSLTPLTRRCGRGAAVVPLTYLKTDEFQHCAFRRSEDIDVQISPETLP